MREATEILWGRGPAVQVLCLVSEAQRTQQPGPIWGSPHLHSDCLLKRYHLPSSTGPAPHPSHLSKPQGPVWKIFLLGLSLHSQAQRPGSQLSSCPPIIPDKAACDHLDTADNDRGGRGIGGGPAPQSLPAPIPGVTPRTKQRKHCIYLSPQKPTWKREGQTRANSPSPGLGTSCVPSRLYHLPHYNCSCPQSSSTQELMPLPAVCLGRPDTLHPEFTTVSCVASISAPFLSPDMWPGLYVLQSLDTPKGCLRRVGKVSASSVSLSAWNKASH